MSGIDYIYGADYRGMKKISKKQSMKNAKLAKIKKTLSDRCYFCCRVGGDLAHVIPKSIFPEYYTEAWNLIIACRECHNDYDGDRGYRSRQEQLFERAENGVDLEDRGRVRKYFGKI